MSAAALTASMLLTNCETTGSDSYDNHRHSDYRTDDGRLRMPTVTHASNGNYIVTYTGGGVATYDRDGRLVVSSGLNSTDLNRAHAAVQLKMKSEAGR